MKVNLIREHSTNSESEIKFVYKLGSLWEREHCIKPNKGIMFLFADSEGNTVFCEWMASKGITAQINNYGDDGSLIGSVVTIDDSPELTKLLLES